MEKDSNKWLYSILVFLIGVLLIALYFLLQDHKVAVLFGLTGIITVISSIAVYYKFEGSNHSNLKLLEEEFKFKYQLDYVFVSNDKSGIVGISDSKELLYLFSRLDVVTGIDEDLIKNQYEMNAISFNIIKQLNIIENDMTIVKSNKSEFVGKSVKGGFGNNGIDNKKSIQRIRVQVVTDDIINPSTDVFLFNSGYALKVNSDDYNKFYDEINKWYRRMKLKLS